MVRLLFSGQGRINRRRFWLGIGLQVAATIAAIALFGLLRMVMPATATQDGFNADGVQAIPYLVLMFGWLIGMAWSGLCLGIKRYHDRDKSGAWVLIQLLPIVGPLWYLVEVGCLSGTPGANRFGMDRRSPSTVSAVFS